VAAAAATAAAGLLAALAAAFKALAAEIEQAGSAAAVPCDIAGLCMMMLWLWRSLSDTFQPRHCFANARMVVAMPAAAQLAVAGVWSRCKTCYARVCGMHGWDPSLSADALAAIS
jgi:hypothetical protein